MLERMLPYFRIYAAETLSDENFAGWSVAERGAWFTLVCICWREGSIPSDQGRLARILHVDDSAMAVLWSAIGDRFEAHPDAPGRLTSRRLEMEREEAERRIEQKSDAGKKGAKSRWAKGNKPHGGAMAVPLVSQSGGTARPMRIDSPQPSPDKPQPSPEAASACARETALEPAAPPATAEGGETTATGRADTATSPPLPSLEPPDEHAGAFERVRAVWDAVCVPTGFARAHATAQQCKKARTRLREPGWFAAFELACEHVTHDPFYRGESKSGWVLTLGWLLEPGNTEKTAERAVTLRSTRPTGPPARKPTSRSPDWAAVIKRASQSAAPWMLDELSKLEVERVNGKLLVKAHSPEEAKWAEERKLLLEGWVLDALGAGVAVEVVQ